MNKTMASIKRWNEWINNGDISWGDPVKKDGVPRQKIRPSKIDIIPCNIIDKCGTTKSAENDLKEILPNCTFDYPKPVGLIKKLIKITQMSTNINILDFYAGSGTTGQAVLELNKEDNGKRRFILCTNNENNIAYSVTYERCKRVMTGKSSDNSKFKWIDENEPLDGSLDVIDIKETSSFDPKSITKIDETIYDFDKHKTISEHINWVCQNFDITTKKIEE